MKLGRYAKMKEILGGKFIDAICLWNNNRRAISSFIWNLAVFIFSTTQGPRPTLLHYVFAKLSRGPRVRFIILSSILCTLHSKPSGRQKGLSENAKDKIKIACSFRQVRICPVAFSDINSLILTSYPKERFRGREPLALYSPPRLAPEHSPTQA